MNMAASIESSVFCKSILYRWMLQVDTLADLMEQDKHFKVCSRMLRISLSVFNCGKAYENLLMSDATI
jgi:hypothetical protein